MQSSAPFAASRKWSTALRSILSPRHPSQLYEAFFEGIVLFAILWFFRTRRRQPNGVLTGVIFYLLRDFSNRNRIFPRT